MPAISVRNVSKRFVHPTGGNRVTAIKSVSLDINAGDFCILTGPSGCGKSTFLRMLAGMEAMDGGSLESEGRPMNGIGTDRIMVFQEAVLFPWLTVRGNVEFGLRMAGMPAAERHVISDRYLNMVGMEGYADYYTPYLSTGQRARIAIARALAMDSGILLMDEPFAALDAQMRDDLLQLMQMIWMRTRKTIVFVTHNVQEAAMLGTRIVVFSRKPAMVRRVFENPLRHPRSPDDEGVMKLQEQIREELRPPAPVEKRDVIAK